jgi:hypothetical protein
MFKVKLLAAAFAVTFVLSAVASSSAQAGWLVLGSLLAGSAAISASSIEHSKATFGFGEEVEIQCDTLVFNGGFIGEPDKLLVKSLEFTGCSLVKPLECTLANSSFSTLPVEGLVTLDGPLAFKAKIKPENSDDFFSTFRVNGDTCAAAGLKEISGSFVVLAPTGQDQRLWQLLNLLVEEKGELVIGLTRGSLSGSALFRLENDMPWSFD